MCGIAGLLRLDGGNASLEPVRRMAHALAHRGPDGAGEFCDGPVALAHRRLSIIDLDAGAQPMETARSVVVFNGEIYNYVELRDELTARGCAFRTRSDTEVILHAYEAWGDACVERFNGMFAFALYDRAARRALLARDHFGVKPLYVHATRARVLFASEIKGLLAHGDLRAEDDRDAVREYLTFQHVQFERTLFRGVTKVLPGERVSYDLTTGARRAQRYWEPRFVVDHGRTEESFVDEVRALLDDAVRMQMRADVPVGAYLSGGMDSSLVTVLASRVSKTPIETFTGRFDHGPEFDESGYARDVAEKCGAVSHVVTPTEGDFIELLPKLARVMDEPVAGPGLFPQYIVSREAARRVKVVLGGQGGDEVFGGYVRYLAAYFEQAIKGAIHETNEEAEHIVSLASILPNLPALRQYEPMLKHLWRDGLFGEMDARYFRLIDRSGGALSLLTADFREAYRPEVVFERFREVFNHPDTRSYFNKMTHYDLVTNLPALLHVEDRVTMASSLESRVPLLDHRITDVIAAMPPVMKFKGGELKYVLKRATPGLLPESVAARKDKMGFPVPLHLWARGRARDFFSDVLLSRRCRERGIFDARALEALMSNEEAFSRRLWGVVNLELWYQTFIDPA